MRCKTHGLIRARYRALSRHTPRHRKFRQAIEGVPLTEGVCSAVSKRPRMAAACQREENRMQIAARSRVVYVDQTNVRVVHKPPRRRRRHGCCTSFRISPKPALMKPAQPARPHPHAEATYRIVPLKDGAFGVEVVIPGTSPTTVTSFATEADAEVWITRHKSQVQSDGSFGPRFRRNRSDDGPAR